MSGKNQCYRIQQQPMDEDAGKNQCFREEQQPHDVEPTIFNNSYDGVSLRTLYGVPFVPPAPGAPVVVVAIVICYHNPRVLDDLQTYWNLPGNLGNRRQGLAFPQVLVHAMANITNDDAAQVEGWNTELCLDLQMVANMNPYAQIVIIEAKDNSNDALCAAVTCAEEKYKANIISMSWGGSNSRDNIPYDSFFTNSKVIYCASSGDTNHVSWPSVLANMMSIGGTSLNAQGTHTNAVRTSEYTWSLAGCGFSSTVLRPAYQDGVVASSYRSSPDVAMVANPATGVNIISRGKQIVLGGTSVSCPIFAGMVSVAVQMRLNAGKTTPLTSVAGSPMDIHVPLYQCLKNTEAYKRNFYDVQMGKDGVYSAKGGFDQPTGLGVPSWECIASLANL